MVPQHVRRTTCSRSPLRSATSTQLAAEREAFRDACRERRWRRRADRARRRARPGCRCCRASSTASRLSASRRSRAGSSRKRAREPREQPGPQLGVARSASAASALLEQRHEPVVVARARPHDPPAVARGRARELARAGRGAARCSAAHDEALLRGARLPARVCASPSASSSSQRAARRRRPARSSASSAICVQARGLLVGEQRERAVAGAPGVADARARSRRRRSQWWASSASAARARRRRAPRAPRRACLCSRDAARGVRSS